MKMLHVPMAAVVVIFFAVPSLHAEVTAVTDPVGFVTIDLPVGSDTIVAPPLTAFPLFQGTVSSRNGFTITVNPSPNWTVDQLANAYYVQVTSGSNAGVLFEIVSNTANTITLVNNGIPETAFDGGAVFKVVKHNTLDSVFPASQKGISFAETPSVFNPKTYILFPNIVGTGINRSSAATYYFNNNIWKRVGGGTNNFGSVQIPPDSYIIVRNSASSPSGLKLTVAGSVSLAPIAVQIDRSTSQKNDNFVSISRPADLALTNLGLVESGAFESSSSQLIRKDELLIFSNSVTALNKSSSATYYYHANGWRKIGSGNTDVGSDIIPASVGVVIRKGISATNTSLFWTNNLSVAP